MQKCEVIPPLIPPLMGKSSDLNVKTTCIVLGMFINKAGLDASS